ncbi:MerR family transcriptional regulator [Sphingopyxis macrogoltabida]|uniref:Uncharacterized protein n=1 Tax=Sphingopyxis macrogoltabida TaxID=33050 RepID=A0AAC9AXF1_SPHMC|nr:DNA-binding protein [Sphingopyxis macrogoltabida]ALJ15326.1 putative transcriptional regulator [Sphingopyxis macrogoltabida]AMU91578.1 hypothetical protein ATM17_21415 [Sphingopyxis macrogoltabida]
MPDKAATMPYWPRLMSVELAALYLGIGTTTLSQDGPVPKRKGRRILYDIQDLDRWADALDGQPLDEGQKKDEGTDMLARVRERIARGSD